MLDVDGPSRNSLARISFLFFVVDVKRVRSSILTLSTAVHRKRVGRTRVAMRARVTFSLSVFCVPRCGL